MLDRLCYLFTLFIFYSILGYLVEVTCCSIENKKLILNRGFCLGPYLPIYGVASIIMASFMEEYKSNLFTVFVLSAVICSGVEYLTSYILEKIFKARWWDYTDKRFNIEGRICLQNSFLFGLGGVGLIYIIHPVMVNFLNSFNPLTIRIMGLSLATIFFTDVVITLITLYKVKVSTVKFKNLDATAEVRALVKGELAKLNIKSNFFVKRMLNAFPKISLDDSNNPLSKVKLINLKKDLINKYRKDDNNENKN